ncbi:MAG: LCP family protein, partial [Candidatus Dormibacteraeota bacterium]|nr:LCP family protein [Candidatus Dormibacteraeota bacterium]
MHDRRRRASAYRPGWRRRVGIAALVALLAVASGAAGAFAYFLPAIVTAVKVTGQTLQPQASARAHGPAAPSGSTKAPFTLLLLGSDNDAKFGGQILTQSMILCRIDPTTKQVTMLSIPRDLYVQLASGQTNKIDYAYSYGQASNAVATVENNFDVHIDHYAWIGLLGLVNMIDKVGGIDVVATNPVLDDFYPKDLTGSNPYAYERVAVLPGPQHMTGMQALEYVRSRHGDLRSDFGRSQRQQQVLLAIRIKAKLLGLSDLPDVADAMANDFLTDMSISEVASLLPLASQITLANVQQVILLPPYTSDGNIAGQSV